MSVTGPEALVYREKSALGSGLLAGVLIFAPLFRGANLPLPLLVLELAGLGLLVYAAWRPGYKRHLSRPLRITLFLFFSLPLIQLVPLPPWLWMSLPGREFYADALAQANNGVPFDGLRSASLVPWRTESAWLALLPPLGVFLVAVGLPTRRLQGLVVLFLGIAVCEALLGVMQYGAGPGSLLRFGNRYADSATGTYVNRNHLAGLLEMALPVGLALLVASIGRRAQVPRLYRGRRLLRQRLVFSGQHTVLYGAATLAMLLGIIFTRSRTGIVLIMLGILLCALLFARRLGGRNVYGLVGTVTFIGLLLAVEIGLTPVLNRFTLADPMSDDRWSIFASTLQAAAQFFPLGSGVGTFVDVYPRFHSPDIAFGGVVNRAHNDYLEGFMEAGLVGIILPLALLGWYVRQWTRVWYRNAWFRFRLIQAGAGIGLLMLLLHSLLDFNLHIPANAIFFAFLAAVFLHRPQAEEQPRSMRRRSKPENDPADWSQDSLPRPSLDKVSNPFAG